MNRFATPIASAPRLAALLAAVVLALLQFSCAATTTGVQGNPMPAARAALRPEYRVFYDELQDYGDWVLIEPYGFVFRPKTRFNNWSPYNDGFWSASDSYGWVWVSGEPFGWATYHYGAWINDSYQGYVWVPGLDWAPAWVAWTGNQNYVGWAALSPNGGTAGAFTVVPRGALGSTDLSTRVLPVEKAGTALENSEPIVNTAEVDHVVVNRGPRIDWVEQVTGPLQRARVEDLGTRVSPRREGSGGSTFTTPAAGARPARPANEFRQAAEEAAASARAVMKNKQASPEVIPRLRLSDVTPRTPAGSTPKKPGWQQARGDSAR